jgi:hypothetical protein
MIGSNLTLSPKSGAQPAHPVLKTQPAPAPTQQQPGGGGYSGQSSIRPPQYIDINTTEDSVNNIIAKGMQQGDQRYQMKQMDKAGFSRGKNQQFIAGQESAQAIAKGASQAAEVRSADQLANSQMRSDYEKSREMEAQNLAMVQHSMGQSQWAQQFAQQSAAAQLQMAYQQAQLQLMLALMR